MKFILPKHHYLGPGNKLDSGFPYDEDDRLAQIHDICYEFAQNKRDIFLADRKAVGLFYNTFVRSLRQKKHVNFGALLGCVGLTAKCCLEQVVLHTTLYPWKLSDASHKSLTEHSIFMSLYALVTDGVYKKCSSGSKMSYKMFWSSPVAHSLLNPLTADLQKVARYIVGQPESFNLVVKVKIDSWLQEYLDIEFINLNEKSSATFFI